MTASTREQLRQEVMAAAELTGYHRASLIPILREVKKKYRGLDSDAMQMIADILGIHPVEVDGVATFYSFLRPETDGRLVFRLCRTYSCHLADREKVAEQLLADLGVGFGETSADGAISLEWTNCMGMCDQGPALLVNDEVYTQLTPDKVHGIVEEYRRRQSGRPAEVVPERGT